MDTPILNVSGTGLSTVWTDIQHILSNENKAEESMRFSRYLNFFLDETHMIVQPVAHTVVHITFLITRYSTQLQFAFYLFLTNN